LNTVEAIAGLAVFGTTNLNSSASYFSVETELTAAFTRTTAEVLRAEGFSFGILPFTESDELQLAQSLHPYVVSPELF